MIATCWRRIKKYWLTLVIAIIGCLITYFFNGPYNWETPFCISTSNGVVACINDKNITFWMLILLGGIASIVDTWTKDTAIENFEKISSANSKLQAENDDLTQRLFSTYSDYSEEIAEKIFKEMGFSNDDRVSIYLVEKERFWLVGRYAKTQTLKKVRRDSYPKNEGVLAKVWDTGEVDGYKNYSDVPTEWAQTTSREWGIPHPTARDISMKSRSMFAALLKEDRNNQEPLAVVAVESMSPRGFYTDPNVTKLCHILSTNQHEFERIFSGYGKLGVSSCQTPESLQL